MPRQTTLAKPGDVTPQWRHFDADGQVLGRLATRIATVLMGKHRPEYTPHVLTGDMVVVTNAEKVVMTGKKLDQRVKTRYSNYPGGLKVETFRQVQAKHPQRLIEDAVRRMVPKGRLGKKIMGRLKVYAGPQHPHQPQQLIASN
ncbi:MAG: 50S ribosomal protein L13 [Phycisphaeraceae bacterium]|nr:50S ribosomal protein L13 [Phycisphaerales bacterium]QOJ16617.1 MAG: 50S ribosomal protein L13 [Phycisphaeraceae bacterium]